MKPRKKGIKRRDRKLSVRNSIRVYVDGSGQNSSGKGSASAFLIEGQKKHHVTYRDGLTNNQAEYGAILLALEAVGLNSEVEILSDSELAVNQLTGRYKIRDPELQELSQKVSKVMQDRKLNVKFTWIPRSQNKAGKLL